VALPIKDTLGILADNLRKRGSVLPLSRQKETGWAQELDIPMGGKTIIYTGLMYQLMPSIMALEKVTSRFENSWMRHFFGLGRMINKVINVSPLMVRSNHHQQEEFNKILQNITCLLRTAGVEFGYLYDREFYPGTLIHDQGICSVYDKHAHRVAALLKEFEIKKIITVDPHTTLMLRSVFPKTVEDYKLEVKSYLEVLEESDIEPFRYVERNVVIHDSCVYSRYEGVIEQPRNLLKKAGFDLVTPKYSGKMTYCCGGPIESLFPGKAQEIARNRIEQLAAEGTEIATMCPICLVNFKGNVNHEDVIIKDISEYLVEAYCY
jgi:Fe-S oxidoreductase